MRLRYLLGALCAAVTFNVSAAIPATEQAVAVEFYHATADIFFVSADTKEIADLDTGVHPGWTRTGYRFAVIKAGSTYPGTSPMCRFFSATLNSHFMSANPTECEAVKTLYPGIWQFESAEVFRSFPVDAAGTCPADTTATYRLYNNKANHRHTDLLSVFVFMLGKGHVPEGNGNPALPIAFCTPSGGDVVPAASATAPSCTVTASTGTPAPGSTLALNSSCTNNPTTFLWMGCNSTQSSCNATKTTAGTASYTLYAANSSAPADPVTMNVTWGGAGGGGGAVPICTLAANSLLPTTGTPLTLTANCSQTPTSYEWMECNYLVQSICNVMPACAASASSCPVANTIPGYARYALSGVNGSGKGPRVTLDVFWGGSGGGTPPPPGGGTPPPPGNDPIPVCSLLASNFNPLVGTNVVLSASCSGNPTSFLWSGVACTAVQCQINSSQPGQLTYSVTPANAAGTGGTAYVTINWGGAQPEPTPACTLSASNSSPTVGSTITITSTCSNSPTGYTWTGCASTTGSCTDSMTAVGSKQYSLVATNASGNSPSAAVTVSWVAVPTTPPACSITASNTQPAVGQSVTLTASCNGSPTAYVWTNCTSTGPTCVATSSITGAATYYVAATNQFGTGAASGVVVAWTSGGGGGGPPAGGLCSQFSKVTTFDVGWGSTTRYETAAMGGFAQETVWVMAFQVPSSPGSYGSMGNTSLAEYRGPPTLRHMTLSRSACDFRTVDPTGANGPFKEDAGTAVLINWNVGTQPVGLVPGQTYYFSWRNLNCGQGSCDASTTTNWPH